MPPPCYLIVFNHITSVGLCYFKRNEYDLKRRAFHSAGSQTHTGESFAVMRFMDLAFISWKPRCLINFTFCLISAFLTKVIRRHPNLYHKYLPICDQKGLILNILPWFFASAAINLFKNRIWIWQTGAWHNALHPSVWVKKTRAFYQARWNSEIVWWDSLR